MKIKKTSKINTINFYIWFLIGVFVLMPVFKIGIQENSLAIYNILLIFVCLQQLIIKQKIVIYKYKIPIYCFFSSILVSSIVSFSIVPNDLANFSMRAGIKLAGLMILLIIVLDDTEIEEAKNAFFKGIDFAAYIEFAWMILQSIVWNLKGISLNTLFFGTGMAYQNGTMVLSGLSWERADTVLVFSIATAMTENKWLKLVCLLGVIMTSSRTGILMLACIYAFNAIVYMKKQKINIEKIKKIILIMPIILIAVIGIFLTQQGMINKLVGQIGYLLKRISWVFNGGNDYSRNATDPHILYYMWLPQALKQISWKQILVGCGTRISGWVYSNLFGYYKHLSAWNIECDFISLILGNGIIGAVFYYLSLLCIFLKNNDDKVRAIIFMIFVSGFAYQLYTASASLIILVLCFNNRNKSLREHCN